MYKAMGLIQGRHEIPVTEYIFNSDYFNQNYIFDFDKITEDIKYTLKDVTMLDLYVTGLTPALTAVIKYCYRHGIDLDLYHYDSKHGEYVKQVM